MTITLERPVRWQADRFFFSGMAVASLLAVLVGFAPTYFVRSATLAPLTPLYQVHGLIFTSWILLFITQTALVAAHRTDIHRRLGLAGAVLAFVVFIFGITVSIETLRRGGGTQFGEPREFLSIPLGDMISFAVLVAAAVVLRRRPDAHKRLMLLATISILTAAVARFLAQINVSGTTVMFLGTDLFVLALILYDFTTLGRIHPASLWGGAMVVAFKPLLFAISGTSAWLAFADALR
jgi:hypothetical protein